jgi:hypothetical protein
MSTLCRVEESMESMEPWRPQLSTFFSRQLGVKAHPQVTTTTSGGGHHSSTQPFGEHNTHYTLQVLAGSKMGCFGKIMDKGGLGLGPWPRHLAFISPVKIDQLTTFVDGV